MIIKSIQLLDHYIDFTMSDGAHLHLSYQWLRDHAQDDSSFDAQNHQRLYSTGDMDLAIRPIDATLMDDGLGISVMWPDHVKAIEYTLEHLLSGNSSSNSDLLDQSRPSKRLPWHVAPHPRVDFKLAVDTEDQTLLSQLVEYGFTQITNCPISEASVERVANRIGYVRLTHFGGVWSFQADQAMADSAYSSDELRPHTDGTYYRDAPGLQLLMCIEEQAVGGESILVDGLAIANAIRNEKPDLFESLCRIPVPGIYKGDERHFKASRPIFRCVDGDVEQVSFNNYDRDRLNLSRQDEKNLYQGIVDFERYSTDPNRQWCIKLKPGEMIVFDNWRLLHGRRSFKGHRKMSGCYVNREEYESCLERTL